MPLFKFSCPSCERTLAMVAPPTCDNSLPCPCGGELVREGATTSLVSTPSSVGRKFSRMMTQKSSQLKNKHGIRG